MKRLYEPVTTDQIKKIHASAREHGVPHETLYSMIEDLISIPSMTALSRQEAVHIIEKLIGDEEWRRPPHARTEEELPGDGENLPTMKQIWAIRMTIKALGWDRKHIKAWLKKYRHASIRDQNREQAGDTYVALKAIQEKALKKAATTEEENGHVIH